MACAGARPTTSMKKGLKNSAPETPDESATVEKAIAAGNTHQWARNWSTGNAVVCPTTPPRSAAETTPVPINNVTTVDTLSVTVVVRNNLISADIE